MLLVRRLPGHEGKAVPVCEFGLGGGHGGRALGFICGVHVWHVVTSGNGGYNSAAMRCERSNVVESPCVAESGSVPWFCMILLSGGESE